MRNRGQGPTQALAPMFFGCSALLLALAGTAKLHAVWVGAQYLGIDDPIFPILRRSTVFAIVALIETTVAILLFSIRAKLTKACLLGGLSFCLLAYRVGLKLVGFTGVCRCFGYFLDGLFVKPEHAESAAAGVVIAMAAGCALMIWSCCQSASPRLLSQIGVLLALLSAGCGARDPGPKGSLELFSDQRPYHEVALQLPQESERSLEKVPRERVPCTLKINGFVFREVEVRLKGQSTFQPLHRRPSFSLKVGKNDAHLLGGVSRLTLENGAFDQTLISEAFGSAVFNSAGVPAPRVALAAVSLNGRNLGAYVLKEGITPAFLERAFGTAEGAVFEGDGRDLVEQLERDKKPVRELNLLSTFASNLTNSSSTQRPACVRHFFDMEHLTRYIAIECFLEHVDGYWYNRNNYRLYEHPQRQLLYLIPHSLDMLSHASGGGLLAPGTSLLARTLREDVGWKHFYYATLSNLLAGPLQEARLLATVTECSNKIFLLTQHVAPGQEQGRADAIAAFASRWSKRVMLRQAQLKGRGYWGERKSFQQVPWQLILNQGASNCSHDPTSPRVISKQTLEWSWQTRLLCNPGPAAFEGQVFTQAATAGMEHQLSGSVRLRLSDGKTFSTPILPDGRFRAQLDIPDDGDDLLTVVSVELSMRGQNVHVSLNRESLHLEERQIDSTH